ncbi:MarR family transcriptional regulator [Paraburkholderia tropica]|uniref:MarR family transcriptional regulator n=1 Tax=Paraburkholderia tropica TaxID=92647 RepID=UPI002AB634DD|nr:hypothetical protein [Paraburkholderia tropica]
MTAAEQILAYIQGHGHATRPELERVFGLYEKTVDSAIRKLERLGCIERTGHTKRIPRRKPAVIFSATGYPVDPLQVADCRGRHSKTISEPVNKPSFDALSDAMRGFFGREAA